MKRLNLPTEINLMRIISQGLVVPTKFLSAVDVSKHLLAVQSQSVFSWKSAILLRIKGDQLNTNFTKYPSNNALQPELIRSRPLRGTLHTTSCDDYHLLRMCCHKLSRFNERNEIALGINEKNTLKAYEIAEAYIRAYGSVNKNTLEKLWYSEGVLDHEERNRMLNFLLYKLDRDGLMAQGYVVENVPYYVLVKDLYKPNKSVEEMRVSIAGQYAYSRGPIQIDDLVRWAGFSVKQAQQYLNNAVECSNGRLSMGKLNTEETGIVETKECRRDSFYFRSDLFDLLEKNRSRTLAKFLLPRFDELHNGYSNRTCLCNEEGERLICPYKNGTNRCIIMENGTLIGVYHEKNNKYYYL